jgi:D-alanine transaminase
MNKTPLANWNGQLMPLSDVKVSVLDRGFLFGDSAYEVVRIYAGGLFRAEDHLKRLSQSLESIEIRGVDPDAVRERLELTVSASGVSEGLAYLQVTRGEAPRTHRYPGHCVPNILIYVELFDDPYAALREAGVSVVTYPDIRWGRNDIKVTSLAANCMAAQFAYERGCAEAVLIDGDDFVTEGSHTSIFGVRQNKILVAPASQHVLPGITKKLILELAHSSAIDLEPERIRKEDLFLLDELFLAGTPEEIVAIVRVDDRPICGGTPGAVVQRLQAQFQRYRDEWIAFTAAQASGR